MTDAPLLLRPLAPALGVEAVDVDVRAPLTADGIDALRDALDREHLLLFRDQTLAPEEQLAFVARFGPLCPERQMWSYVSNARPDGIVREGALRHHADFAFAREPTLAISLHALEVPPSGAPTVFANAVRAVELLAPELRARIEHAQVRNIYDFGWPDDQRLREHQMRPGMPRTDHPFLRPHPRTGVPVLFANEMHTDRVLALAEAESEELLAAVFAVLYAPENCYVHEWAVGDLVLWDNIALHHGRPSFDRTEARTLRRVALGRYTAAELVPNLAALLGR
jgi:taurine dioxygenase